LLKVKKETDEEPNVFIFEPWNKKAV